MPPLIYRRWGLGDVSDGEGLEIQMKLHSLAHCSPLLCELVPKRPPTGTSLAPGCQGPLL